MTTTDPNVGTKRYHVEFEITSDDLVAYVRIVQRTLNLVGVVLGLAVIAFGTWVALTGAWLLGVAMIAAGILTIIASATATLDRWRVNRYARRFVGTRASFDLTPRLIHAETGGKSGDIPWAGVNKIKSSDRILVVMRGRTPLAWIPTRAFRSSEVLDEAVASMLRWIDDANQAPTPEADPT